MKKYFFTTLLFSFFWGCKSYDFIEISNIKSVHVIYSQKKWENSKIYKLEDGSIIEWDKNNSNVKDVLLKQEKNIDKFKKIDSESLNKYLLNKKNINYSPIKVTSLKEFGYIITNKNKIIFYGIMGERTFIDLTNDKVYF